mgnify:CR=1 FL=1
MASLLEHLDAQLAPLILSTEAALATVDAQSAATTRACTAADALLEGFLTRVRADEAEARRRAESGSQETKELAKQCAAAKEAAAATMAEKYALEARLAQALTDCKGLSSTAANMRARARTDEDTRRELRDRLHALEAQLKDSVPAEKVQSVLEAAAQRVSGICDGAAKSQRALESARRDNRTLKKQVENIPRMIEERLAEEIRLRKRAETKARDATARADKCEARLRELEASTSKLQNMLKSAQEGIGVMKTIARIRNGGDGATGVDSHGRGIGFDAVARTIDRVSGNVDAKVRTMQGKKKKGGGGAPKSFRRRKQNDAFANMINY